jgi:DNA-binding transcriptional regulator YiaG
MTPATFRAALAALGYTQAAFAAFARVDTRTVRKWAAGDRPIPGPVETLIEVVVKDRIKIEGASRIFTGPFA